MQRIRHALAQVRPSRLGRLSRSASVRVAFGNAIVLLLTTGTGVLSARLLGPEGRGQQAAMIMWPQLLAGLFAAGIPSALLFNLRQPDADRPALLGGALCAAFAVGLAAAGIGALAIGRLVPAMPPPMMGFALLALLTTPLEVIATVLQFASQASGRYDVYNRVRVAVPLVMFCGLIALPHLATVTPIATSALLLFAGMPILGLHFLQVKRQFRPTLRHLGAALRVLFRYARRCAPTDFLNTLSLQADRLIVVAFLPATAIGIYAVAVGAVSPLAAVSNALAAVVFPRAVAQSPEASAAICIAAGLINALVMTVAAVALWLVAPFALRLLYGAEFLHAVPVMRLLIISAVLTTTGTVLSQLFLATGKPEILAQAQLVWLVALGAFMLALLPPLGLEGAAGAVLGATGLRTAFILLQMRRACGPTGLRRLAVRQSMISLLT